MEGGGILTLWSKQLFNCLTVEEGKGLIVVKGEYYSGGSEQHVPVAFMNVYSPCFKNEKYTLWVERIKGRDSNMVWCVAGDFTAVRYRGERKGLGHESDNRSKMVKFNKFIGNCELVDIPVLDRRNT